MRSVRELFQVRRHSAAEVLEAVWVAEAFAPVEAAWVVVADAADNLAQRSILLHMRWLFWRWPLLHIQLWMQTKYNIRYRNGTDEPAQLLRSRSWRYSLYLSQRRDDSFWGALFNHRQTVW